VKTESVSSRFENLDVWSNGEILEAMIEGQLAAIAAVRAVLPALSRVVDAAVPRLERGGRLAYAGAGTSGRLGVQDGVELTPTFNWPTERLVFLLAGGDASLTRSIEGAEDDADAGRDGVESADIGPDDVLLGIAASGATAFTVAAVKAARSRGALTVGIANNEGSPLLAEAEHALFLDTGPEVVAGSTRMKAGTAQKAVLNLFSTLLMIRMGRVYGGYMVDVQATNRKLVRRAERMLVSLTGCGEEAACDALRAAGGHVKTAVLVLQGLGREEADAVLDACGGNLRAALERIG